MFSSNTSQVSNDVNYIEDVFSTYLYTGNGSTQAINNGIDLAGKGGLVWAKARSVTANNTLFDTARGVSNGIYTNTTEAQTGVISNYGVTAFNSNGFSLGGTASGDINTSGATHASWTFRKAPKFFDVVTFTIDGASSNQQVAHNLGSTPGCIFVKASNAAGDWFVYHNATGNNNVLFLNGTQAASAETGAWSTSSTNFGIKSSALFGGGLTGKTAVAYLFAHDAGGFGLSGTDNVISCGSYTGAYPSNVTVNLGFEPQFILVKNATQASDWFIYDTMRGMDYTSGKSLAPNSSAAENGVSGNAHAFSPTATGFIVESGLTAVNVSGNTHIYIAIRRGPMKTPTSGTSVYNAIARTGTGAAATVTGVGFAPDLAQIFGRDVGANWAQMDRLRGTNKPLGSNLTAAEDTGTDFLTAWGMDGVTLDANSRVNASGGNFINHFFRRAPGFFDEVCYTGTGANRTVSHNLGVAPELMIVKGRNLADTWSVYHSALGNTKYLLLNQNYVANTGSTYWNNTSPTASVFTVGTDSSVNANTYNYAAWLFASCPGVQSIQSYVGDGTTGRTINCGFTGGARFVCIKATSTTGSWWTFDSARGIVTNNDPALQLNSTAAEVTSADAVDTAASGFIVNQEATCSLNASGVTYLVWAIA